MTNNQFKSKKVAIIGAGTIGLYLGWKLAEKGHLVTIFEKKAIIGKEACSGLFSERILKFAPESEKLVQNEINSVLIHFPRKTVKVQFSKKILVMSHKELDILLADTARRAGVEIILNHNITGSFPVAFDRIIGCDGAQSFVRKSLKLAEPSYRLGILGFKEEENFSDFVEVWPGNNGFSWKIPKGKNTEYGIIGNINEVKLEMEDIKSALIPQGLIISKNEKITLCGDAAGLTKPWSGGGVVWGLIAAEILLKSFPDFLKYRKLVKRRFCLRIIFSKIAVKLVYFLGFKTFWLLPKSVKIESDFLL